MFLPLFLRRKKISPKHLLRDLHYLILHSQLFRWTTMGSLFCVSLVWILPIWRIIPLTEQQPYLPLHYNIYFGIDQFGPWYQVFFLPILGTILLLVNTCFEAVFFQKERIISTFFALGTVIAEGILFVSMLFIVLLNI